MIMALFTLSLTGFFIPCPVQAQDQSTAISKVIELKDIHLEKGTATGITVMGNHNRPVAFMIKTAKGFAVCGHFDLRAMGKSGIAVVQFRGARSIEEAVEAKVVDMSRQAKSMGIKKGMPIKNALEMMM